MSNALSQGQKGGKVRWALNSAGAGAIDAHTLTLLWDILDWGAVEGEGEWRPVSWRYIAQRAQVGRTTVYKVLKRYVEAGVIEQCERWSQGVGARLANAYRFTRKGLIKLFQDRGVKCDVLGVTSPPKTSPPQHLQTQTFEEERLNASVAPSPQPPQVELRQNEETTQRAYDPHVLDVLGVAPATPSYGSRPASPNERPTHTRELPDPSRNGLVKTTPRYKPTSYVRKEGTRATGAAARLATGHVWRDPHDHYVDTARLFERAMTVRTQLSEGLPHFPLLELLQDLLKRWHALEWADGLMYNTSVLEDYRRYAHGMLRRFHKEHNHTYSPEREGAFIEALINLA